MMPAKSWCYKRPRGSVTNGLNGTPLEAWAMNWAVNSRWIQDDFQGTSWHSAATASAMKQNNHFKFSQNHQKKNKHQETK